MKKEANEVHCWYDGDAASSYAKEAYYSVSEVDEHGDEIKCIGGDEDLDTAWEIATERADELCIPAVKFALPDFQETDRYNPEKLLRKYKLEQIRDASANCWEMAADTARDESASEVFVKMWDAWGEHWDDAEVAIKEGRINDAIESLKQAALLESEGGDSSHTTEAIKLLEASA